MDLNAEYNRLNSMPENLSKGMAIQRGHDFEKLIRNLFADNEILSVIKRKSYHTSDNSSEQIDGVSSFDGKVFLLEAKWSKKLAASSLYEFIGKVENKFHGTLGIYISAVELSDNFINSLRKGRRQNVIVIHGDDVDLIFERGFNLKGYIQYALEVLSYDNISHIPVSDYLDYIKKVPEPKPNSGTAEVDEFIKQHILGDKLLTPPELDLLLQGNDAGFNDLVFEQMLKIAKTALRISLPIPSSYHNSRLFLSVYQPSTDKMEALADLFFSSLIFDDPDTYLQSFTHIFSNYFSKVSDKALTVFNDKVVDLIKKLDYDGENNLTLFIRNNWKLIDPEVQKELSKVYLDFYYSSRLNKFPQKQFSHYLARNKLYDESIITDWVKSKLKSDYESYKAMDMAMDINYFAVSYQDLAQALDIDLEEWKKRNEDFLKEIKNKV